MHETCVYVFFISYFWITSCLTLTKNYTYIFKSNHTNKNNNFYPICNLRRAMQHDKRDTMTNAEGLYHTNYIWIIAFHTDAYFGNWYCKIIVRGLWKGGYIVYRRCIGGKCRGTTHVKTFHPQNVGTLRAFWGLYTFWFYSLTIPILSFQLTQ